MANKFTVEMQLDYSNVAKQKDGSLQKGKDVYYNIPDGSTERTYRKPSSEEIKEARAWIKEQRAKYPGTLEDLFVAWEKAYGDLETANATAIAAIVAEANK